MLCRLNEIRVLKVRLADMRRELHVLRTGVANVDVLKREVSKRPPGSTDDDCMHCTARRTTAGLHAMGQVCLHSRSQQADCRGQQMMGVSVCVCAGGQPGPSAAAGAHKGQGTQ